MFNRYSKTCLKGHLYIANTQFKAQHFFPFRNIPYNINLHITDSCSCIGHILRLSQVEFIFRIVCILMTRTMSTTYAILHRGRIHHEPPRLIATDKIRRYWWNEKCRLLYGLQYVYPSILFRHLQKTFLACR